MKTYIIVIVLFLANGVAMCATNNVITEDSYEKLTKIVVANFEEDKSNLLAMQTSDRKFKTALWLHLLDQINRTRDVNYNPQDPSNKYYLNVAPPFDHSNTNTWGYDSGVDPSVIKDPIVRQAYQEAILENHQKAIRFEFEWQMKKLEENCSAYAVGYFKSAYAKTLPDAKELIASLEIISNERYRTELKERLADYVNLLNSSKL